jgi:hypothetical protein
MKNTTAASSSIQKAICIVARFGGGLKNGSAFVRPNGITMDPRPAIDIIDIRATQSVLKARIRQIKQAMPKEERVRISYVVNKYRKKQRKLLEEDDIEDPNPYAASYIFYCLETERVY